ncbi:unnamed protein product [Gemmata massiliana]|uniref:Uncharacterized protein n=1 Tax=Gemmata massiliana TaxID=1210884 RepID=A0A6P2CX80_9BACT|nr:unnamed protein product [Gemmata massiliana]
MYLGRDSHLMQMLTLVGIGLQFGPRCIWGETPQRQDRNRDGRGASIRPQMYLGRDAFLYTSIMYVLVPLQFGPRCIWGETPLVLKSGRATTLGFNSAPDVSGERLSSHRYRAGSLVASIRPQMYLGRDDAATRSDVGGALAGFNSAPDVSGERPPGTCSGPDVAITLQFGPRCIWGETGHCETVLTLRQLLQFGPRCIWGETRTSGAIGFCNFALQFGPRCIWGETSGWSTPTRRAAASIRPQMYLGRDLSEVRREGHLHVAVLQFGPRCIWGETKSR